MSNCLSAIVTIVLISLIAGYVNSNWDAIFIDFDFKNLYQADALNIREFTTAFESGDYLGCMYYGLSMIFGVYSSHTRKYMLIYGIWKPLVITFNMLVADIFYWVSFMFKKRSAID